MEFLLAGLVKAVNTAVDLIVAHFGTSRDPGVKVGKKLWQAELYPADPHPSHSVLPPSPTLLHLESGIGYFRMGITREAQELRPKRVREDHGRASNDSLFFSTPSTGKAGE